MDPNQENRRTITEKIWIEHIAPDDPFHPIPALAGESRKELWRVWATVKVGLLPSKTGAICFSAEADAQNFVQLHPVGSEWPDQPEQDKAELEEARRLYFEAMLDIDDGLSFGVGGIGDEESGLAFDVLDRAGLSVGGQLSDEVASLLGENRIRALQEKYLDNWRSAALFEYCFVKLPRSSAAYIAAMYQFHHYISGALLQNSESGGFTM